MSLRSVYFPRGWDPDAPNNNLRARWDLTSGLFTRWDPDGNEVEQRPLTGEETAELQAVAAEQQTDDRLATLSQLLVQAVTDNHAYLQLDAPTAADRAAQVRRLTRQCQAVIRYLGTVVQRADGSDLLDDISDVTTP